MVMNLTRTLSIAISSLVLLSASGAWSDEENYISDSKGCKIANPSPKPNETVTWSGECRDGFAEGIGVMQWFEDKQPGARYEGALAHGALSGEGTRRPARPSKEPGRTAHTKARPRSHEPYGGELVRGTVGEPLNHLARSLR
jgi:hypothetical protein